jgi:hypothetical protein
MVHLLSGDGRKLQASNLPSSMLWTCIVICLALLSLPSQAQRRISAFLLTQYNQTVYDRTLSNNPWGAGLGLQTFINIASPWKPTLELTADAYVESDKVLRLDPDGSLPDPHNDVRGTVNVFAGTAYYFSAKHYVSVSAGPSFIRTRTFVAIKPSYGFHFSPKQRWTAKLSYLHVFNRYKPTKQDFVSVSIALGYRIF